MRFTRARDLVTVGLVVAVFAYLMVRLFYGSIPPLPTLAATPLFALAILEAAIAMSLRSWLARKRSGQQVAGRWRDPMTIVRAMVLAKASSLLGAIMMGVWLGVLGYVLPRRPEVVAAAEDTSSAVIGVGCSAVLIGAALWLEWCCRTPDDEDSTDSRRRADPSA